MKASRNRLHEIIFEADTAAGKAFDVALLWLIVLSVLTVIAESVPEWNSAYHTEFVRLEWGFTALFTLEYVLRLLVVKKPWHYARSFFGLVDLLAILPTFIGLIVPGSSSLRIIRILRVLRVFRVLKLVGFIAEAKQLQNALRASRRRIIVFLSAVLALVTILGTLMYLVEDEQAGFSSIPRSIYWAIVTITTVGYGDITVEANFLYCVLTMSQNCSGKNLKQRSSAMGCMTGRKKASFMTPVCVLQQAITPIVWVGVFQGC